MSQRSEEGTDNSRRWMTHLVAGRLRRRIQLEPHDGGDGEGPQRVPRVDDERQGGDPRVVERRVVGRDHRAVGAGRDRGLEWHRVKRLGAVDELRDERIGIRDDCSAVLQQLDDRDSRAYRTGRRTAGAAAPGRARSASTIISTSCACDELETGIG